ncbi:MAG: hypothetical protein AAF443_01560 [Chlamydiota bacterium]
MSSISGVTSQAINTNEMSQENNELRLIADQVDSMADRLGEVTLEKMNELKANIEKNPAINENNKKFILTRLNNVGDRLEAATPDKFKKLATSIRELAY